MNIVVVDDEREIADVIELYLQNDQYTVYKSVSYTHLTLPTKRIV